MSANHSSLAFIFPGQGSQSLKMMAQLYESYPQVKALYDKASEVLGYDLWTLTQEGPLERLNQTEFTQPALLTASIAAWKVWCERSKIRPSYLAGHSLGEYSALVAANAISFEDALQVVSNRGKYMQEAVPAGQGAMAAILGLSPSAVESACIDAARDDIVEPANINAPGQIVIAGDKAAVERACALLKEMGAKRAMILPVSVPSHCDLMQSAAKKLEALLEQVPVKLPEYTLFHNVDVVAHQQSKDIKNALVSQLYKPVQWIATIEKLAASGIKHIVECGPGKVLSGLTKRIDKEITSHTLNQPGDVDSLLQVLEGANEIHES
jgi:[acyl-carrier-protein] S-malonyltransferase